MTAIIVSDRKIAANRANAARSTGPRSVEGKGRSAGNALKHGLRAEIVVLPTEDAAAFEASRDAWIDDWNPASEAAATLVERAVAGAWRLRRCVRMETDRLAARGRAAIERHEERVERTLAAGREALRDRPEVGVELLRSFWEGADCLREGWTEVVRAASGAGSWVDWEGHHVRAMNLMGHAVDSDDAEAERFAEASITLLEANGGEVDRELYPEREGSGKPLDLAARDALSLRIIRLAYAKIDELEGVMAELTDPEAHRSHLAELAGFDDSAEGQSLARYEASHDRAFRATLNALIKLTDRDGMAAAIEATESEPAAPKEATEGRGSEVDRPTPKEATEVRGSVADRATPNEATGRGVTGSGEDSPNEATEVRSTGQRVVSAAGLIARRMQGEGRTGVA